jgi:hypothetical protein
MKLIILLSILIWCPVFAGTTITNIHRPERVEYLLMSWNKPTGQDALCTFAVAIVADTDSQGNTYYLVKKYKVPTQSWNWKCFWVYVKRGSPNNIGK